MLSIMPDWSFAMMLWLLPVVFFIHDGEEIATMEWWLRKNKNNPRVSPFSPVSIPWDKHITLQFTFAVLLIGFILTSVTAFTALNFESSSPFNALFAGFVTVFLLDGVKHVGASIALWAYTPGVITAAILEIPYGIYALYRLLHADIINMTSLALGTIIALPITLVLVWTGLTLGKRIAPFRQDM
ncbi:HXXEE domain-containing protein [Paenibacillus sp. 843]|uniref:HXXEE domain-containing protein n=1 Tax=Paenibacillus sp. 843 TaxID=3341795 RepID=UPI002568D068|nr:HXXEE domain-containing protein [Yersinia pestis]